MNQLTAVSEHNHQTLLEIIRLKALHSLLSSVRLVRLGYKPQGQSIRVPVFK